MRTAQEAIDFLNSKESYETPMPEFRRRELQEIIATLLRTSNTSRDQAAKVNAERNATYGDPHYSMKQIGLAWTPILQSHYQKDLPHPVPPHVVALMMVAMKMHRAASPFKRKDNDDYVDGHNYLDYAEGTSSTIPRLDAEPEDDEVSVLPVAR